MPKRRVDMAVGSDLLESKQPAKAPKPSTRHPKFSPQRNQAGTCGTTLLLLLLGCMCAQSATVTLNDSIVVNASPMRIGVNVSTSNYYDSGQLFKNLLFTVNPGFEGFIQQEIVGCISGTVSTCTNYYQSDLVPSNYWAGATAYFCCSASSSDANLGLTRIITSNTTASGSAGPTYTFNSPLPQPVATDDYFSVALQVNSTGSDIPGWSLSGAAGGGAPTSLQTRLVFRHYRLRQVHVQRPLWMPPTRMTSSCSRQARHSASASGPSRSQAALSSLSR